MNKSEYAEYLKSNWWKTRRIRSLELADYRCQLCNKPQTAGALHVHHRTYKNLGFENDYDLTVLCAECHEHFHNLKRYVDGRVDKPVKRTKKKRKNIFGW